MEVHSAWQNNKIELYLVPEDTMNLSCAHPQVDNYAKLLPEGDFSH